MGGPVTELEIHATFVPGSAGAEHADHVGQAAGWSLLMIELSQGVHPMQSMFSKRVQTRLPGALEQVRALSEALTESGHTVVRVKVEAPPDHEDPHAPTLYLEHHLKVAAAPGRLPALAALAARHDAHLSRNAHRKVAGLEHRFLTQRFRSALGPALEAAGELVAAATADGWSVLSAEMEQVIYDSNLGLDEGWGD